MAAMLGSQFCAFRCCFRSVAHHRQQIRKQKASDSSNLIFWSGRSLDYEIDRLNFSSPVLQGWPFSLQQQRYFILLKSCWSVWKWPHFLATLSTHGRYYRRIRVCELWTIIQARNLDLKSLQNNMYHFMHFSNFLTCHNFPRTVQQWCWGNVGESI